MTTITTTKLSDPRQYDCCAHVTKGGNKCGALRWYHDDPGRKRHKFVEPQRVRTDAEIIASLVSVLRDELDALQRWQKLCGIFDDDVKRGMEISIDKIETVLKEVEQRT